MWVAIPDDWVILRWYACGADGRSLARSVYGHVIINISLAMGLRPPAARRVARGAPLKIQ